MNPAEAADLETWDLEPLVVLDIGNLSAGVCTKPVIVQSPMPMSKTAKAGKHSRTCGARYRPIVKPHLAANSQTP